MEDLFYQIQEKKTYKELDAFIKQHKSKLKSYDWFIITKHPAFKLHFAEKYPDDVDWEWISIKENLSIDFIKKHLGYLNLYCISRFQKLDYQFILDNIDILSMDRIIFNDYVRELPEYNQILKIYEKMAESEKWINIWEENRSRSSIFRRAKPIEIEIINEPDVVKEETKTADDFKNKNELKEFLKSKGVKVLQKDTMEVLLNKLGELYDNKSRSEN